jgi:hypothetical protein
MLFTVKVYPQLPTLKWQLLFIASEGRNLSIRFEKFELPT